MSAETAKPPAESPRLKVNRKQVADVAISDAGAFAATEVIAQTATQLAPVADAAFGAAMDAAGEGLVASAAEDPMIAVAGRAILFLGLRGLNKYLRDESGSTAWVWSAMGRKLATACRELIAGIISLFCILTRRG